MPNLYDTESAGSAFGAAMGTAAMISIPFAADWALTGGLGLAPMIPETVLKKTGGHIRSALSREQRLGHVRAWKTMGWWGRRRVRARAAAHYSQTAWKAFMGGGLVPETGKPLGWNLVARYQKAQQAMRQLPGVGRFGKAPVARALLRGPLSFAAHYVTWASLIPDAVNLGLGLFEHAAAEGARLRRGEPETVSRNLDMATRQQALTMRQASAQAIHMSQQALSGSIGNEASFLHG